MTSKVGDQDILKMIEEKRKKAMELRKRRMEEQTMLRSELIQNDISSKVSKSNNQTKFSNNMNTDYQIAKKKNENQNLSKKSLYTEIKDRSNQITTNTNVSKTKIDGPVQQNGKKIVKMSIMLESNSRFAVSFGYETEIINIFKHCDSKRWDPITKKWSFSIVEFRKIISQLKDLCEKGISIKYENFVPESLIQILIDGQNLKKDIDLNERLEPEFIQTLYPYQCDGIIFGIQRNGRCLIADDMGLGKTIQAIGLAKWFRDDWPLIIVCPSSLRYQWKNFIVKWIPDVSEKDIFVATNTKDLFPKVPISITSYELLVRMRNRLSIETNRFYKMIIMDESHYIKSDTSQRTSLASLIARSCKRVILLSGTPALSRPIELYPQLNIIAPDIFPTKHGFGVRYCNAQQKTIWPYGKPIQVWDYKGAQNLDELRIILENTIMVRRLKKDVLNELPSKKRDMISLSMDHVKEKDKKLLNKFKYDIKSSRKYNDRKNIAFSWFHKSAEVKITAVNEYLLDILQRDIKLICFCHHQSMLDGVEEMLNREKINHIRIDGSTDAKIRQEACEVFQKKESFKVALLSLTACATGLNLTAASMVVFTECYWNPGVLAQAEDRAHRIGQSKNVLIVYLLARGTIDEMIWPMISKKLDILNKAGLSRDTFADTHNPLKVEDDQSFITEFVNLIDRTDLESIKNEEKSQKN